MIKWQKKCPIARLEKKLLKNGNIDLNHIKKINQKIISDIKKAIKAAEDAPYAPGNIATENVYL